MTVNYTIDELRRLLRRIRYNLRPSIYWARSDTPNWGDDFNPWLFQKLTGSIPIYCPHKDIPRLLMAGSIIDQAGPLDSCWGSGLIKPDLEVSFRLTRAHATRGPLTRDILVSRGVECSDVFGDPGLLAPDYVNTDRTKRYALAIVPHYIDYADGVKFAHETSAELVPVSEPIETFIQRIAAAERVCSSSLHGLICAEALGIPAFWIRFSDGLIGGNFKFRDYLAGTGRLWKTAVPVDLRREASVAKVTERPWDPFPLVETKQGLLKSFPLKLKSKASTHDIFN